MDRAISIESRRVDLSIELPFLLGRVRVDPPAHEITIGRRSERMQPQTVKVLVALHDKIGQVVTRDELIDRCWDGRIVSEDVINRCVLLLRRFAEESRGFRIETVPRAGYRLIEAGTVGGLGAKWRWLAVAAALGVAATGITIWVLLDRPPASQGMPPTPTVSVVPFKAEGNDALTRQVAEAAPVSLSRMLSQSGFAIVRDDVVSSPNPQASEYLLNGTVRHTDGTMEANVQLVSRRDGTIVYAHDFSAPISHGADLPDRIGATVVTELGWAGAAMVLDPAEGLSPPIRSELMSAISLTIEGKGGLRAYLLDKHAATAAPNSAFAQLSFAILSGQALSSIPRRERAQALALARRASDRGRALAPEFGDVYISWCLLHSPVRLIECEAHLRRALEIDSRSSSVPGFLSFLLHDAGLMEESLRFARQSLANDPYRPPKLRHLLRMLELSGQSDEAEEVYQKATRLWPEVDGMRGNRLVGMAERGNYIGLAALSSARNGGPIVDGTAFTALLAAQQKHDLAKAQGACSTKELNDFTLAICMTILADLGDLDGSFAIARDLYPVWDASPGEDQDRSWLNHPDEFDTGFIVGPAGKSMRADARFLVLADRLGLLAYWRSGQLPDFCTKSHELVCAKISRK